MAQSQIQYTNSSEVSRTIVGRQMRQRSKSKEKRRICVLSDAAGQMLEQYGVGEPCYGDQCHHAHYTREQVGMLIEQRQLRYVDGSGKNVAHWIEERYWTARNGAMQLVPGNPSKRGPNQHAQRMPQLPQSKHGPVITHPQMCEVIPR